MLLLETSYLWVGYKQETEGRKLSQHHCISSNEALCRELWQHGLYLQHWSLAGLLLEKTTFLFYRLTSITISSRSLVAVTISQNQDAAIPSVRVPFAAGSTSQASFPRAACWPRSHRQAAGQGTEPLLLSKERVEGNCSAGWVRAESSWCRCTAWRCSIRQNLCPESPCDPSDQLLSDYLGGTGGTVSLTIKWLYPWNYPNWLLHLAPCVGILI